MNRPIEFRAWDISAKKYIYPKLWDNSMPSNWEKHYILEQFIGLLDKNGIKVFEFDKIHCWGGTEFNGIFEYNYYGTCKFSNGSFYIESNLMSIDFGSMEYIEVIGNIHES